MPLGVIVSIDGNGAVTLHAPRDAATSSVLEPEGATLLPDAYELDDAPHFERFFFVTAAERIPVRTVLDAARTLAGQGRRAERAPLPLPSAWQQSSFLLQKEAP